MKTVGKRVNGHSFDFKKIHDDYISQRVRQFEEKIRSFESKVIVLEFTKLEFDALQLGANHHESGDLNEYVKSWVLSGLENDIEVLAHETRGGE